MINVMQQDSARFEQAGELGGAPSRSFHNFPVGYDTIVGTDGSDTLVGTPGDDTLDGGGGRDQMSGGLGNDTYIVDNFQDVVVEDANAGTDTVLSSVSYIAPSNVENMTLTGSADISARGNELNNVLTGNAGNNVLNGLAGADTLIGGLGNDTYVVGLRDHVVEYAGGGTDTILASVSFTAPAYVENVTLTGSANINATGNELNNVLTGNAGVNVLTGGLGDDTYVVDNIFDQVIEREGEGVDTVLVSAHYYELGPNIENMTLSSAYSKGGVGNSLDNLIRVTDQVSSCTLDGGFGDDTLIGNNGSDYLYGGDGGGNDFLFGGDGNDYLRGDSAPQGVDGGDWLDGGAGNDWFHVNALGADTIDGGDGVDILYVGQARSNESWHFTFGASGAGQIQVSNIELAQIRLGEASDFLSAGDTDIQFVQVECGAGNDTIVGGTFGDVIFGRDGNDSLSGGDGNDTLQGGFGNDTLTGGGGNDFLVDGQGADSDHDRFIGGAGNDIIALSGGNNVVVLNSLIGSDHVRVFGAHINKVKLDMNFLPVGDGDSAVEGAATRDAPGGFDPTAELTIFSSHIHGALTAENAAAQIGSAASAYAEGQTALFVVENDLASAVYYFKSAGADALVSASELTLLATLLSPETTFVSDYAFSV